jgi:hypothetical protein
MEKEKHLGSETKRRAFPAIVAMLIVALLLGLVAITVVGAWPSVPSSASACRPRA